MLGGLGRCRSGAAISSGHVAKTSGVCALTTETDCNAQGTWQGTGTVCDPNPCYEDNGSIAAWGDSRFDMNVVPSPNAAFIAMATGYYHNLGLRADGSVIAWGNNNEGQCNVPEPNTGFAAVAAGATHSLGLKSDGSIVAWGDNRYGQIDTPIPNTGFVAIAAGHWHSLGVRDGTIVAWGDDSYGQCDVPGRIVATLQLRVAGTPAWDSKPTGRSWLGGPTATVKVRDAAAQHHAALLAGDLLEEVDARVEALLEVRVVDRELGLHRLPARAGGRSGWRMLARVRRRSGTIPSRPSASAPAELPAQGDRGS